VALDSESGGEGSDRVYSYSTLALASFKYLKEPWHFLPILIDYLCASGWYPFFFR
jgi:hypothetical protein